MFANVPAASMPNFFHGAARNSTVCKRGTTGFAFLSTDWQTPHNLTISSTCLVSPANRINREAFALSYGFLDSTRVPPSWDGTAWIIEPQTGHPEEVDPPWRTIRLGYGGKEQLRKAGIYLVAMLTSSSRRSSVAQDPAPSQWQILDGSCMAKWDILFLPPLHVLFLEPVLAAAFSKEHLPSHSFSLWIQSGKLAAMHAT